MSYASHVSQREICIALRGHLVTACLVSQGAAMLHTIRALAVGSGLPLRASRFAIVRVILFPSRSRQG